MTETNKKIIDMIKQKKSIEEISKESNLSYKQLYNRISDIQRNGYVTKRRYDTNGTLYYTFGNDDCYHSDNSFELYNEKTTVKFLVISDLHMGNISSDEETLYAIYNYCCKNDIHVIINCGDILDGTFSNTECFIPPEEQIEYLIKKYPFDKSIFTLYTPGDHDISLYAKNNISIDIALNKRRHDICAISPYVKLHNDVIMLNNNQIMVSHKAPVFEENNIQNIKLHLVGHNHTSKTLLGINDSKNVTPRIMVPPLCRNHCKGEINIPRAIELTLYLDNKYHFKYVLKKDLLVLNSKVLNTGETIINYGNDKLNALNLENTNNYIDDNETIVNKTFKDSEEKEIGELSNEQKQKLNDFFGNIGTSKKLDNMIKKSIKRKQKRK